MSSQHITIYSSSRDNGTSTNSADCTIVVNPNLDVSKYSRFCLKYASVPPIQTINSSNNTFQINVTGAPSNPYTVTLTNGYYDASSLATVVQSALTSAVSNSWSVSYSSTTKLFTVSGTSAFQLLFSSGSSAASTNNIWRILGFASSNGAIAADTASATSTSSTQTAQLSNLEIHVRIEGLGSNVITADSTKKNYKSTFVIPDNSQAFVGSYSEYDNKFEQWVTNSNTAIERLRIFLTDKNGNTLNLNNADWMMVLKFDC